MNEPQQPATPGEPQSPPEVSDWRPAGDSAAPHPPLPRHIKWGGLGLLAALVAAAVLVGVALGGGFGSKPEATASPELSMDPPVQVGEYVRGRTSSANPEASPSAGRQVSAEYSDGSASLVFLMVWPLEDLSKFMDDAGVQVGAEPSGSPSPSASVEPSASGFQDPSIVCGISADTNGVACAKLVHGTGVMVAGLSGQQAEEVAYLLDEFEQAVTP